MQYIPLLYLSYKTSLQNTVHMGRGASCILQVHSAIFNYDSSHFTDATPELYDKQ
jgi:hypothetical protein